MKELINLQAEVITFYADTPKGTTGKIINAWPGWVRLYFGRNQKGTRLQKSFPIDCVKIKWNS